MNMLMKINKWVNMMLTLTGGVFLVGMILLTCANILVRQIYSPIPGSYEITGFAGAIVAAFALGYTQFTNGHISVTVLYDTYPKLLKRVISVINHSVCCLFFLATFWYMVQKALTLKNSGELSETLRIIYYPVTLAVAFGCFILALALFTDLLKAVLQPKEKSK